MMNQYHGTWGRRVVTRNDPYSITTILYLEPNKRCSWHKHSHQFNQFFVINDGELTIKTDIGPDGQRNYTTIKEGQSFLVPPGVFHEFQTGSKFTIVEEIAFVEYNKDDILREALGGDVIKDDHEPRYLCPVCGGGAVVKFDSIHCVTIDCKAISPIRFKCQDCQEFFERDANHLNKCSKCEEDQRYLYKKLLDEYHVSHSKPA